MINQAEYDLFTILEFKLSSILILFRLLYLVLIFINRKFEFPTEWKKQNQDYVKMIKYSVGFQYKLT